MTVVTCTAFSLIWLGRLGMKKWQTCTEKLGFVGLLLRGRHISSPETQNFSFGQLNKEGDKLFMVGGPCQGAFSGYSCQCKNTVIHTFCILSASIPRLGEDLAILWAWFNYNSIHSSQVTVCIWYIHICMFMYVCMYRERESQNMKISYNFDTVYLPSYTLIKSTATTWRYQTHYLWYFALWMIFTFLCIL